ncbi:unnamed protein product [Mycena citricolor]|uniref:Uncharacterized protein n=1 Tax=Mycena citricolor TaxID=2018698 RepID=A0AAD2H9H3_9AGAR|nr:unnamed protein product [Mycena citricolor]
MLRILCTLPFLAVAIATPIGLSADLAALDQISLTITALGVSIAALPSSGPANSAQLALFQTSMNNLRSAVDNAGAVMLANPPQRDDECGVTLPPIQEVFPDRFVAAFQGATIKADT